MKIANLTMLEDKNYLSKRSSSSSDKTIPKSALSKSMEAILNDLRNSFGQYSQKSLGLKVLIEDFVRIGTGNQILGINREGHVTAIDFSFDKEQVKHYSHAFTGIVANSLETQAFLPTQEGKIVVLDISDIFRLRIINEIQYFAHPVDAIRILSSGLLIAYDFNGIIETFKLHDSQILRVELIEYQTAPNVSSIVSPNGEYLLFYNHQSMCVFNRLGNKIYERERNTRNCCLSDTLFAYMTENLEEDEIHVRKLADPFNLFLTISPDKRDSIAELYLSEDSMYLMGIMNNQTIKIWELLDQKKEILMDISISGLLQLKFGKNKTILYSTTNYFCIKSFLEFYTLKSIDLDSPELCTENLQENKIVISSRDGLSEIDLDTAKVKEYFLPQGTSVTALRHFEEGKFCIGISDKSSYMIRMQSIHSPDVDKEPCILLESQAVCVEMTKNKDLIFVGCSDGKIVTINTFNWTIKNQMLIEGRPTSLLYIEDYGLICGLDNGFLQKVGAECFESHSDSIISLGYSSKGILVSCSKDGRIGIWNLDKMEYPIAFLDFPATTIQVTTSGQFLYSISASGIFKCWCLETFNCLFTEDYSGYHSFFITDSEKHMALIDQTSLKLVDGPLNEKVRVTGTEKKNDFIDYIRQICTGGKAPEFEEGMENGVILPFMIAPTHLYVAFNLAQHLEQTLLRGNPVFNSADGLNPLNLAAKRENGDCFILLVRSLKKSHNPHALGFVDTSTLISLNKSAVPGLSKLYKLLFLKSSNTSLTTHINTSSKLPQYILSENKVIEQNEFAFKGDSKPEKVAYWESQFKFNPEPGSIESMEFLRSLARSKNNQFLTSNFMKNYLRFKWRQVKWAVYTRFFLYLALLISVVAILFIDQENIDSLSSYVIVLFILNTLITILDIMQMLGGFRIYMENIWNLIVIARIVTIYIYVATVWVEFDRSLFGFFTPDDVYIALVTWPFVQGFSYFRVFSPTRYMVHLLVQVVMDIRVFMLLFTYTVFCIACILYVILDLGSNSYLVDYFLTSGALSFANFDVETFSGRPSTAIFSILVNTLVMLNVLIAIIGDTYDKVQDSKEVANNRELAKLMLEVEPMMYWKRNKNRLKYFHMCGKDDSDHGEAEWLGRIREVKLILKKQDKEIKETRRYLDQKLDLVLSEISKLKSS